MTKISAAWSIIAFCFFYNTAFAQVDLYDVNTIQQIEIHFSQTNWDYQLDTAKYGADGYIIADWVKVNGVQFDSAGVKYKGNSSYDSTYIKNPVHIELDNIKAQSYLGYTDIKLGNGYADPSLIREVLAYDILSNYMDAPLSNFAQLYINGNYIGVYSNAENIGADFCSKHFYSSSNTFFKCNPIVNPGPTTKSNLKYIPLADSTGYFNFYELKSKYGWNELVALCDTVTNHVSSIGNNMDMDRVMWMLAFNTMLVNLDSYTGVFCQNYYLYKDGTNRFNPVVWDLNMAFGGFPFVGSGNSSMGSLSITNMMQLSPTFHAIDPYWPLINAVMGNASYKKQFIAHARTINNENFVSNNYLNTATQLQALIDTAAQSDNNSFFTYSQFQNALTADYPWGSYTVPGISNLVTGRVNYLQTNADFMLVPPAITNVIASNTAPQLFDTIYITAGVTNTNAVYLGYRGKEADAFTRVVMYDDGLHNDGAAGDNNYGGALPVTSLISQYYVYAENNDAGMFSPERAEHEFYTVLTQSVTPAVGQVTINEFLASNINGATNETGDHADWIELRNNTGVPLTMFGLYLSDDVNNPTKYAFPQNTFIPANGYLVIWADENSSTPSYLHCNFKLSASGELIMLSNGTGVVFDLYAFGTQFGDVSTGRCPDGTGSFGYLNPPTFNAPNCAAGIDDNHAGVPGSISLYPNPAGVEVTYATGSSRQFNNISIYNCTGQLMQSVVPGDLPVLDITSLNDGVYFVKFSDTDHQQQLVKLVKLHQR